MPTTIPSDDLPVEQQLAILLRALASPYYWVGVGTDDDANPPHTILTLYSTDATDSAGFPASIKRFVGTQAECVAQLAAYQMQERLT